MSAAAGGQPTLGRYTLIREIARSNDIVWEGRDPQMNRRVAVKELSLPHSLAGQARRDRIERFYREARAAGAMSHPNIVTIYEVGEDRGRYFIAMEYLEGQTLRERLSVGGPIPLSEMSVYATALCSALQYAHERDVIHRDIKPDNIHILPGGILKLTDFGIARITTEDQLTIAGQIFGTPSYMSPEQVLGHPIDARSDQFSLAIVTYEMIGGLKPFSGDSVPTITYRIIHEQAPHVLGAPPAVDAVLQRAMSKAPGDRYATVSAFATALQAAIAIGTGSFAAARSYASPSPATFAPQLTAQYSAQTQLGMAPGQAMQPATAPPLSPSVYEPPPADSYNARRGDGTQKTILAVLISVALIASVLVGGGILVTKAFHNFNGESSATQTGELFAKGAELYKFGDYEDAALAFNKVRLSPGTTEEMRQNAIKYEVYCYRQLGHKAQETNDLETAAKWYQSALTISPGDAQAQSEMAAVQRLQAASSANATNSPFGSVPGAAPAANANPAGTPATPGTITTGDFVNARDQNEARAQPFLQAGKAADAKGDFATAQQQYSQAIGAGPGSPSAIEANTLLLESRKLHPESQSF